MPARAIGSATVSFGLVSIPVRLYVATHSHSTGHALVALAPGGTVLWSVSVPAAVNGLLVDAAGTIFTMGDKARAFRPSDGAQLWEVDISTSTQGMGPVLGVDGRLYVPGEDALWSISP